MIIIIYYYYYKKQGVFPLYEGLDNGGGERDKASPLTCAGRKPMVDVMGRPVMEYT